MFEVSLEFRVNYVVVGIFVLVVAGAALMTGLWLSAGFQNKTYNTYEILMYEPVSGLNEQAPVKFNGVQIGYIKEIKLNPSNPRQVILLANIEEGTRVTKSTVATLMAQGITGVTYIGLKAKTPNAEPLKKLPGQLYPIIPSTPSFLVEIDSAIRELSTSMEEVTDAAKRLLNPQNIQNVQNILEHTNRILQNWDNHQENITHILQNTDAITKKIALGTENFPNLVKQFNTTLVDFDKASNATTQFLAEANYAVRQWSNQIVPTTYSLIYQFTQLTNQFEDIASELKQQPSLLIRGKTDLPLGPGEQ